MKKPNGNFEPIKIRGFARLQVVKKKDKTIVGDTGWLQNQVTNYGMQNCIVALPFKCSNSVQATGILLGSGTGVASSGTQLASSNSDYWASFGQSTVIDSFTVRATCSFDGTLGAMTAQEIGVFAASTGTCIAAKSFNSSAIGTDEDINCTYEFRYST